MLQYKYNVLLDFPLENPDIMGIPLIKDDFILKDSDSCGCEGTRVST